MGCADTSPKTSCKHRALYSFPTTLAFSHIHLAQQRKVWNASKITIQEAIFSFYSIRSALFLKVRKSIAKYQAVKSAYDRDESRYINSEIRSQAVISSLQNKAVFYPLPTQQITATCFTEPNTQPLFSVPCKLYLPIFLYNEEINDYIICFFFSPNHLVFLTSTFLLSLWQHC